MKTLIKNLLGAAAVCCALVGLGSCDDDNDMNYDNLTLITQFDVDFDDDFLQLCDVTVSYKDFDGISQNVPLTAPDYEQMLTTTTFPASSDFVVTVTKKPNVTLTNKSYDLDFEVEYEANCYLGTKKTHVLPKFKVNISNDENVPKDQVDAKLDKIIEAVNGLNYNYTFTKTAANTVTAQQNK